MGAHTNSDDPTRYVPDDELREWRARDPIERFRRELERAAVWDDDRHLAAVEAAEARLDRIIDAAFGTRG